MDQSVLDRLDLFIRKKGLRRTPQRDAIVRTAFASDEHFTSEELFDRSRKANAGVSRATVYRTISLLVEAGLLHEIDLGGDLKTYDPNFVEKPSHNHLVCIDCGKVVEFADSHLELLNDCLTRRMGFRPVRQSIKFPPCCDHPRKNGGGHTLTTAGVSATRLPPRKRQ